MGGFTGVLWPPHTKVKCPQDSARPPGDYLLHRRFLTLFCISAPSYLLLQWHPAQETLIHLPLLDAAHWVVIKGCSHLLVGHCLCEMSLLGLREVPRGHSSAARAGTD